MIDLLTREIRTNFPIRNSMFPAEEKYLLHCSRSVYEEIMDYFKKQSFMIPTVVDGDSSFPTTVTRIMTPSIGYLNIEVDMDMGYKIEKI